MSQEYRIKLNESNLVIWKVTCEFGVFYDKKKYSFENAIEHFISFYDSNPLEENEEEALTDENDSYYLTSGENCWYMCDDQYGYNLEIKILDLIRSEGIDDIEVDGWGKEEIDFSEEDEDGNKVILTALSNYNEATDNNLKVEGDFLIGNCFNDFVEECPCNDCLIVR